MKKLIALILCLVMALSVAACGTGETAGETGDAVQTTPVEEESTQPAGPEEGTGPAEDAEPAGSINLGPAPGSVEESSLPEGLFSVDALIEGVPAEWFAGVGEQTNLIRDDNYIGTTYKDTDKVVSGYCFYVGANIIEDDYSKLLAYFDTLEYTGRSAEEMPWGYETVYTTAWGNCQVRYNRDDAVVRISWRTFENP